MLLLLLLLLLVFFLTHRSQCFHCVRRCIFVFILFVCLFILVWNESHSFALCYSRVCVCEAYGFIDLCNLTNEICVFVHCAINDETVTYRTSVNKINDSNNNIITWCSQYSSYRRRNSTKNAFRQKHAAHMYTPMWSMRMNVFNNWTYKHKNMDKKMKTGKEKERRKIWIIYNSFF